MARILLTVHTGRRGGASLMAVEAARALARRHDLTIAAGAGPVREDLAAFGRVVDGPPSLPLWTDSPLEWARRSARTAQHAVRLAALVRRERIDAVLVNSTVSLAPVIAARLARVPVIVHARDTPFSRWAPLVMRAHARLADTIVCIAAANEGYLPARRRARVVRVPDGIRLPPAPAPAPAAFGPTLRLCVVGAITPDKGQDVAVEALAELRRRGTDAELHLAGRIDDPAMAAALRARAAELGVAITLHGETDGIDPALAGMDLLLLTSRGEGTPLVLMEALARHVPVVAARVGGVPEVVRDGATGLLVAPADPAALAEAVARLHARPDEARAMALAGRRDIEARFDLDAGLARLDQEIARALTTTRRRAGSAASSASAAR
jgi:glycosyltransferase involved in cell wall biosynthesis